MTWIVDRFGMERVLTFGFALVAAMTLAVVAFDATFWLLASARGLRSGRPLFVNPRVDLRH
jgi:hypothetical protein